MRANDQLAVAPGNPYLGVMLPYTPLHHLLLAAIARPIVCTSGNLSEEPMAISTDDALRRLAPLADAILTHNRPIVRPVDDSVARVGPDGLQLLRRARGYAPLPIELGFASPTILAVGGHLKNTVALALGGGKTRASHRKSFASPSKRCVSGAALRLPVTAMRPHANRPGGGPLEPKRGATQVILSAHVGDLDHRLSVEVHRQAVHDLVGFFEAIPDLIACDLHPDYASTRHAEMLAARWDVPLVRVQHHHAHVAACMAEHKLDPPVLGLAWDGTGYGTDGTVWGGEALACQGAEFTRVAHLRTFTLPGGDRAAREPRRSALGILFELFGGEAGHLFSSPRAMPADDWFKPPELDTLVRALARGVQCPRTSSMGRLFDAVAALCGLPAVVSFEGQAAMALEFAADETEHGAYPLPLRGGSPTVADWEPLIRALLADRATGVPVGRIAARFHNALAEMAAAIAMRHRCHRVALTGGCFQNALLTERVRTRLRQCGFAVYTHRQVPPGDGGIALGQVHVAATRARRPHRVSRPSG